MTALKKTSDKLLAGMLLGAVILVAGIHLALFAQFRSGHIMRWRQLQDRMFAQYHMPPPAVLSLTGTLWVELHPSDSFYIELPKKEDAGDKPLLMGKTGAEASLGIPRYSLSGDTLSITGDNTAPIDRPFANFSYRMSVPRVNIYGSGFRDIRLLNGQLVLYGSDSATGAPSIRLTAKNSTVEVAEYEEPLHTAPSPKFFDSLDLHLFNTDLVLNRSAKIRKTRLSLDDDSWINDRWSTIGRSQISGTDSAHIDLTGANLKNATIEIH